MRRGTKEKLSGRDAFEEVHSTAADGTAPQGCSRFDRLRCVCRGVPC